jgi:transposase
MVPICLVNEEILQKVPEEIRQLLRALRRRIVELERTDAQQRIAELEDQVRSLQIERDDLCAQLAFAQQQAGQLQQQLDHAQARLRTNSSNSSLPPSSDRFHRKRKPPPPAGQPRRKRGGQPGHPRHLRPLVPQDQVQHRVVCKPRTCRRCGRPLAGDDPNPLRHQVAELPVVTPDVVEYQLHRLLCPGCHTSTCGELPAGVHGQFRPRLQATLALLTGCYRLGVRSVVQLAHDLWGLDLSCGMVNKIRHQSAEALLGPWYEVYLHVRHQNVHIDETTWRQCKELAYLWCVATPGAVLFRIARRRTAAVAQWLLGKDFDQVATCDRLKSYWWIKRLQWCWAHLRRDFQAMIDRGNAGKAIGERLLAGSDRLFHHWHRFCRGELSRAGLQQAMSPVRDEVGQILREGRGCGCAKTAGTCRELLEHEEWLWTFVDVEGVEPTNNEGERQERAGVLWRKCSGGTDSASGSRFVERMLTVVATCRRQGKSVLPYLGSCLEAEQQGRLPPRLLPDTS